MIVKQEINLTNITDKIDKGYVTVKRHSIDIGDLAYHKRSFKSIVKRINYYIVFPSQ